MKTKAKDLRVIRTRALLCQALEKMLKTTPIKDININDICAEAMVNRSTFYKHFNDKYDFLQYYVAQASEKIYDIAKDKIFDETSEITTVDIIKEIEKYDDIIFNILQNDRGNMSFNEFMSDTIVEYCYSKFQQWAPFINPHQSIKVLSQFYAGGLLTIILNWVRDKDRPDRMSAEDLAEQINAMFENVKGYLRNIANGTKNQF